MVQLREGEIIHICLNYYRFSDYDAHGLAPGSVFVLWILCTQHYPTGGVLLPECTFAIDTDRQPASDNRDISPMDATRKNELPT